MGRRARAFSTLAIGAIAIGGAIRMDMDIVDTDIVGTDIVVTDIGLIIGPTVTTGLMDITAVTGATIGGPVSV